MAGTCISRKPKNLRLTVLWKTPLAYFIIFFSSVTRKIVYVEKLWTQSFFIITIIIIIHPGENSLQRSDERTQAVASPGRADNFYA